MEKPYTATGFPEKSNFRSFGFGSEASKKIVGKAVRGETGIGATVETYGGDCGSLMIGDLPGEGFKALIFNHEGIKGQDALSINRAEKRFAVADGLGGTAGGKAEVAQLSMATSRWAAEKGADAVMNPVARKSFLDKFAAKEGVDLNLAWGGKSVGVKTTLSTIEMIGDRAEDGSQQARILPVGDSPIFICDAEGNVINQFGEDAISGTTDSGIGNTIGYDAKGAPIDFKDPSLIADSTVKLELGQLIVVASDYFSDEVLNQRKSGKQPSLARYMNISSADEYKAIVTGPMRAKSDDASIIFIDPSRL